MQITNLTAVAIENKFDNPYIHDNSLQVISEKPTCNYLKDEKYKTEYLSFLTDDISPKLKEILKEANEDVNKEENLKTLPQDVTECYVQNGAVTTKNFETGTNMKINIDIEAPEKDYDGTYIEITFIPVNKIPGVFKIEVREGKIYYDGNEENNDYDGLIQDEISGELIKENEYDKFKRGFFNKCNGNIPKVFEELTNTKNNESLDYEYDTVMEDIKISAYVAIDGTKLANTFKYEYKENYSLDKDYDKGKKFILDETDAKIITDEDGKKHKVTRIISKMDQEHAKYNEKGGYVEFAHNLENNSKDNSWIDETSVAIGKNTHICKDSDINENSIIIDSVIKKSRINNAKINKSNIEESYIKNNSYINNSTVEQTEVNNSLIDTSEINDCTITDESKVVHSSIYNEDTWNIRIPNGSRILNADLNFAFDGVRDEPPYIKNDEYIVVIGDSEIEIHKVSEREKLNEKKIKENTEIDFSEINEKFKREQNRNQRKSR